MSKNRSRQTSLPGFDLDEVEPGSVLIPQSTQPEDPKLCQKEPNTESRHSEHSEESDGADKILRLAQDDESTFPTTPSLEGKSVWVIDSHSLIHQVFHALPEMTSPKGEPVGAVFGFTRDLMYLLEAKKPDYLFCAFDLPGKTFRHTLYESYKADRGAMPDDLVPQIASVHRVIEAFGIPALSRESFEADDVLATVARITEELGGECFVVTADKDSRQLITDRVKVFNIRKNEIFDRDRLATEWGIKPEQVVDFQALVGDSVDNVPGVPLIGPKFAKQLLEQYGTLDEVLDHASEVAGAKRKENLLKFRDQALLSRDLVRLDSHVPLTIDWQAGRAGRIHLDAALALFHEFGFRGIGQKLTSFVKESGAEDERREAGEESKLSAHSLLDANTPARIPFTAHLINTPETFTQFLTQLQKQSCFSFDTETTSVAPRSAKLVGMSFAWNEEEAWYLALRTPEGEPHLDIQATLTALKPILENAALEKIGQNLKYDMIVLRSVGIEMRGVAFDTMVASYLLDAGRRNHNLDDLAQTYLHHETIKITELIGKGKDQRRMDEVPSRLVADYAAEDAWLPWRLRPILAKQLEESELSGLLRDLELPLIDVLVELEYNGIRVDTARLAELSRDYGRRIVVLEQAIYDLAERKFNIASPKQLQQLLFDELKLPVIKKTAKTGPSTDAEVLEELARVHPLPAKILEYRQYAKLKSTYLDALQEMVCPETGRVHASFNQVVTATGRLSSSDPNLQNIPVRTQEGREIRSAFVPSKPGWVLMAADYSQIELRVLAHYSGDAQLCEAFAHDEDIHARVASQVNRVPLDQVTKEQRRAAKAVNFGVVYGQGAFGLARNLGIDQDAAARFIDQYFAGYPGIEVFLQKVLAECRKNGYVKTILGRRRAISGVREGAGRQRNLAERTAVNTVIQGSAADLIKLAMVAIHRRLQVEPIQAKMLLQIHDELVFEVPSDQLYPLAKLVTEEMVGVCKLQVPLKVDMKAGSNWAAAEALDGS